MKRKLLSLILVVAMLASMAIFVPTASATESQATLEFGTAAGAPGEAVTVDFTITTEALTGLQFMFEYDASRLTYDGITWTDAYGTGFPADLTNNNLFVKFTQAGPYRVESWATGIGVGAVDLSAGVVVATLNFTIKEDAPLGDAKVAFAVLQDPDNAANQPNKLVARTGELELLPANMTFVDGKVTVLPADYSSPLATTDADWDFEDGVIYGMLNDAAMDYTGAIVIPSQIGGVNVTEINSLAFDGYMASTIVVPATVEYLGAGAIYNCENLTSVYILNAAAELDTAAVGYGGGVRSGAPKNPAILFGANDAVLTSIYGVADSTAQAYAAAGDGSNVFPFYAEASYAMSFNGETYLVPAETVMPGSAVIDGKTVVAWTDGENTYAAGAAVTLTKDVALEPVTITAPVTSTEVDFKLANAEADLAMRFTATLSKADYATLASLGTVKLGMLITPAKRVTQAGSFTKEALDALDVTHKYVDIAIDGYYKETTDDYILAGSLKGFSASTLAKNPDFAAVVYATVTTAEGDTFTVYGDFNFGANQDVKSVAEAIVETNITNDQKTWLNTLIGKFTV